MTVAGGFIVLNEKGQPIGLDRNSGGYPFVATHIRDIQFWSTLDDAAGYIAVMHSSEPDHGWTVHKAAIDFSVPVDPGRVKYIWQQRNAKGGPQHLRPGSEVDPTELRARRGM